MEIGNTRIIDVKLSRLELLEAICAYMFEKGEPVLIPEETELLDTYINAANCPPLERLHLRLRTIEKDEKDDNEN